MTYLITASLYSAYHYYAKGNFDIYDDPEKAAEAEAKAKEDLLNTLKKIKTAPTEAMQRGIDFEELVRDRSLFDTGKYTEDEFETAKEIGDMVHGGYWQETVQKKIGGYLFYGKADVILRDTIYDIKRVSQYDIGKYQESLQHLIYLECSSQEKFKYLISDGKSVYVEDYFKTPKNQLALLGKTAEMVAWFKANKDFAEPFEANWQARDE